MTMSSDVIDRAHTLSEFQAILFDLDGVVLTTATLHARAWKRLFDEFLAEWATRAGQPFEPFDIEHDYRLYLDGRRRTDGVAAFLASRRIELEYGTPSDPPEAETCCGLGNRKNGYFRALLADERVDVYPDTLQVLDALRSANRRLGVVSSSEHCTELLEIAGVSDRFSVQVTGLDAARWGLAGKPSPATYLKAAELLKVPPKRAAILEDAIPGVQAGKAGGFGLVVGVDRHGQPQRLRDSGADVVVTDVTDLLPSARKPLGVPGIPADLRFEAVLVCPPTGEASTEFEHPPLVAALELLQTRGVEIALSRGEPGTDLAQLLGRLERRGIGPGLVLVIGWLSTFERPPAASRTTVVSVLPEMPQDPLSMQWLGGGAQACAELLLEQAERRSLGLVPSIDEDPAWTITLHGDSAQTRRHHESLLTVADTRFGVRGVREEDPTAVEPRVLAAGTYDETVWPPALVEGPGWTGLRLLVDLDGSADRRTLDLHTGVLYRDQLAAPIRLRTMRFASLVRPGCLAMRAEGGTQWLQAGPALTPPVTDGVFHRVQSGPRSTAEVGMGEGGTMAAATVQEQRSDNGRTVVERLAGFSTGAVPGVSAATGAAAALEIGGADRLRRAARRAAVGVGTALGRRSGLHRR